MKKPAEREGAADPVRSEAGEDAFALAPWLKDVPVHPLMVNPVAAMAATTAIGLGMASQFAGMMFGAMRNATAQAKAALDEAAQTPAKDEPVKAKPALTVVAERSEPVKAPAAKPKAAKARPAPQAEAADDLKAISGIGPKLEQVLNGMGYRRYADIAALTAAAAKKIEAELGLDGRIARDGWVEQAKALAKDRG